MGLDWVPLEKPKPGHEAEFARLFHLVYPGTTSEKPPKDLAKNPSERELAKIGKRFDAITIAPHVTARAPVVGRDKAADNWARAWFRAQKLKDFTAAQFMKAAAGSPVCEVLPPHDGLPPYTNGGFMMGAELYSFRAQFIVVDCAKIVGDALLERCFHSCFAPGLANLGRDIEKAAERYAARHGVVAVARRRRLKYEEGRPRTNAHILFSAAKWCAWWSRRGHGLYAYW